MATEQAAVAAPPPSDANSFAVAERVLTDLCHELHNIDLVVGQKQLNHDALWKRLGRLAQIVLAADKSLDLTWLQQVEHPNAVTVGSFTAQTFCEALHDHANHVLQLGCHAADIYKSSKESDVAVIMRDAVLGGTASPKWGKFGLKWLREELERFDFDSVSKGVVSEIRKAARQSKHADTNAAKTKSQQPQVVVTVDVESIQATIQIRTGKPKTIDLPSKQVARWVKVLCDRPRRWVPASELVTFDNELDGARTSILSRSLRNDSRCSQLAKLIETDNHHEQGSILI